MRDKFVGALYVLQILVKYIEFSLMVVWIMGIEVKGENPCWKVGGMPRVAQIT